MDIDLKGISIHLGSEPFEHNIEIGGKTYGYLASIEVAPDKDHYLMATLRLDIEKPFQFRARFVPSVGLPNEGLEIEVRFDSPITDVKLAGRQLPHRNLCLSANAIALTELSFDARLGGEEDYEYTHVEGVLLNVQPLEHYTPGPVETAGY